MRPRARRPSRPTLPAHPRGLSPSLSRRRDPTLRLAAQPTRGVDVGSIEFIHRRVVKARDKGAAVLLVSAELDEIMSLPDWIAAVPADRVVAEMDPVSADRGEIGRLRAGGGDAH